MGKKGIAYIVIALITVALLLLMQYNKPKEVNWFPSFVSHHKIPYGTYVLNQLMKNIFEAKTGQITVSPFEFLNSEEAVSGTYFFVNDKIVFGKAELNALLNWTAQGNTLFIASNDFEKELLDTLHLKTSKLFAGLGDKQRQRHHLVNPLLRTSEGYPFLKDNFASYFSEIDSSTTTIIGSVDYSVSSDSTNLRHFNGIKQPFGQGEILLTTFPKAFTNYFILNGKNKDYTAGLLSYIDGSRSIYIDDHHKSGKTVYTSPMYIFLNTKEFKWAYYLVLIGTLIYIVFEGKRKQRAIAVVHPLKNQTLAFTRTIADMYYDKGERKTIATHKISYFLEYLRSTFHLSTTDHDVDFFDKLAARSNHSVEDIKKLFKEMDKMKKKEICITGTN